MALRSNPTLARANNASDTPGLLRKCGLSSREIRLNGLVPVERLLSGARRNGQVVHSVQYAVAPLEP